MAKTYEQRMIAYRSLCINHAQLEVLYVKFEIASGRADSAGAKARIAAYWAFKALPKLRNQEVN